MTNRPFFKTLSIAAFYLCAPLAKADVGSCVAPNDTASTDQLTVLSEIVKTTVCESKEGITNQAELDSLIQQMFANQKLELADDNLNRHEISQKLNDCSPQINSKGLVISFEGTGSFNPKAFDVMTDLMSCLSNKKMNPNLLPYVYNSVVNVQKSIQAKDYKWSGVEAGPLSQFFSNPELSSQAKNLNFVSFASEESEILADANNLSFTQLKKIPEEMLNSVAGVPTGIRMASKCTQTYLDGAAILGIKPKIIVLSHSSGGRSAVKFAEHLKQTINPISQKQGIEIDLVFSIDPVKEAHEAVKEVLSQYGGRVYDQALDKLPFVEVKEKPINVWTRDQPLSLYRPTNNPRWINVYQNVDTEGLKGPVKFGIHGSPISNASLNQFIAAGLGSDAHGAIAYHPLTTQLFVSEFKKIII